MTEDDNLDSLRTPLLSLLDPEEQQEEAAVLVEEGTPDEEPSNDDSVEVTQHNHDDDGAQSLFWHSALHKNLLPDEEWMVREHVILEGSFSVKLLKFLTLTFGSIFLLHWIVSHRSEHRDEQLKLWQIWVFDGGLIVRDAVTFFLVGRLWRQRGIDHLAWVGMMILANVYFESQNYIPWLQHSFTLYEMHCAWPWQLWVFVGTTLPLISTVVGCHIVRAYREKSLLMKAAELSLCMLFFLAPVVPSPYFHFHQWFAGWLLGMHCNFDVWWSSFAMGWCWGMYINGIAVYGRDPVLTCEYAHFLSVDQKCPFLKCYSAQDLTSSSTLSSEPSDLLTLFVERIGPADWRNCSADGYHP
jgi:hypothetical protein